MDEQAIYLDNQFFKIIDQVAKSYESFSKHEQIRVQQWSRKLCQVGNNNIWRRNRNAYAKLLLTMLQNGSLDQPFKKCPSNAPLENLDKTLTIRTSLSRKYKFNKIKSTQRLNKTQKVPHQHIHSGQSNILPSSVCKEQCKQSKKQKQVIEGLQFIQQLLQSSPPQIQMAKRIINSMKKQLLL